MKLKSTIALVALVFCAQAIPAAGNPKTPVERPFRCEGTVTWSVESVDPVTGLAYAVGYHTGVATHAGRFVSECWAWWDFDAFEIVYGEGVSITASGAELVWNMVPYMTLQFTGGTGRFINASGEAPTVGFTLISLEVDSSTGLPTTMTIQYTVAGTITY